MMTVRGITLCIAVTAAAMTPLALLGQEPPTQLRHAVLIVESIDGEQQDSSAAEGQLMEDLLAKGVIFVDEEQARKIRSVTDAGTLVEGKISEVITSLDADIIVAGKCKATLIAKEVMGQPLIRYDADIQVKVIAVDTGEIIGAYSVRGEAMDFNASQSAIKAARKAANLLTEKILTAVKKRATGPKRIEITVNGTGNVAATQQIKTVITQLAGIKNTRVLQAGKGVTKLSVDASGVSAGEVALQLQSIPDLGLEVWGYTDRAIKADYSPAAALGLPLVIARFENKTGSRRYKWVSPALAEVFGIELANLEFLQPADQTDPVELKDSAKAFKDVAKEMGLDVNKTVIAIGSYSGDKNELRVEARIVAAASGKVVLSGQTSCKVEALSECTIKLAGDMAGNLLETILKKKSLFKRGLSAKALSMAAQGGGAKKPLELVEVQVENLFPSRMARYSQNSVGVVKVRNMSEEGVDNLVVSAQLVGFMDAPLDQKHGVLEAGGEAEVPIKVILDKARLVELDENRPAMLTVKLSYNVGEFRVEQDSSHSVMVYDRNSISWSQPRSVAAFVTPKAEGVARFASLALDDKVAKELRQNPLYYPVLLHGLIGKSGIKYLKDAVNPYGKEALDYVQYPEESLGLGTGDCDDLAVLYSTLLESVGNRAALVLTPGHVLMAADTNVPVQHFQRITPDRNKVIFAEGTVWIPVETTLIGSSFEDAWKRAAEVVKAARQKEGDLIVVPVRQAWKDYAPTNLAGGRKDREFQRPADLLAASEAQVAALDKTRSEHVVKILADLDSQLKQGRKAGLLNTKGVILAREGRFAEARKLFDESQKAGGGPEAWNNLGNIEVAENKLDAGLECYANALKAAPEHIQVHLNAGIALFMKGNFDDALDHFVQCIELGAEEQVAMLGMLGVGPGGGAARGAEGGGAAAGRDLAELALKAFTKTKKKAPKAITDPEERKASEAGGEEKQLSNYLFWL